MHDASDDTDETEHPAGAITIRGASAFGLRAAALAGLAVTTASAAVAIAPVITVTFEPCCVSTGLWSP